MWIINTCLSFFSIDKVYICITHTMTLEVIWLHFSHSMSPRSRWFLDFLSWASFDPHVLESFFVSFLVFSLTVFVCILCGKTAGLGTFFSRPRNPMFSVNQALLSFITPTQVAWPKHYSQFIHHKICRRSRIIRVPFLSLVEGIRSGVLELRNANDLPQIFLGGYCAHGWTITIDYDADCWTKVNKWLIYSYFCSFLARKQEFRSKSGTTITASQPAQGIGDIYHLDDPSANCFVKMRFVVTSVSLFKNPCITIALRKRTACSPTK